MHIVASARQKAIIAQQIEQNILLLVCLVPLCVPFGLVRNLGLQAFIVILTGLLACVSIYLRRSLALKPLFILLALYVLSVAVSLAVNPTEINLIGSSLMRFGGLELLACVLIGLALRTVKPTTILIWLYVSISVTAIASLPFTRWRVGNVERIGGVFYQADLLAVVLAAGLCFGIALWQTMPRWRPYLLPVQAYKAVVLLLTQTRAAVGLVVLAALLQLALSGLTWQRKLILIGLAVVMLLGGALVFDNRLTDAKFAGSSVSYRHDLLRLGTDHLTDQPLAGYGPGNVRQPLACEGIAAPELVRTCQQHRYFNSSHNIFLDRALALGWIGGSAFIAITGLLLLRGRRLLGDPLRRQFLYAALIIAAYYLTNVSGVVVELLLWICLLQLAPLKTVDKA